MGKTRLLSWNVNGLRAVVKKGFTDWFAEDSPDILCLQEIKASEEQLPKELLSISGYEMICFPAQRKGYSGTALLTKQRPERIVKGLGIQRFDSEGRTLIAEYGNYILFNVYFPNGKASKERLDYKMDFYDTFLDTVDRLKKEGKNIIVCGDVNTAHTEIDLARPKENEKMSGFLPEERAWIDKLVSHGFIDTFRIFHSEGGHYSWWDYKTRARERNVGWRIDYIFISENLRENVTSASILSDVTGSDHCPVGMTLSFT
ncbi:MAG: exodeoxyribonuclease III [bacterium]